MALYQKKIDLMFILPRATYIIEELNQSIGSQLSIILNDFIISEDINTLHLIQTLWERKCKDKLGIAV